MWDVGIGLGAVDERDGLGKEVNGGMAPNVMFRVGDA